MRLAIFGGSFNPVHLGHLFIAEEVLDRLRYDRILFVPTNVPVHKKLDNAASPKHRLRMLQIATRPYRRFRVDDCELRRGGDSYTIDTVREVLGRYPVEGRPGLILGDDLVDGFDTWKEAGRLARLTELIVVRRTSRGEARLGYPHTAIDNAQLPVSSSEIRERIRAGRSIRHLVPERVLRYIRRHRLYA